MRLRTKTFFPKANGQARQAALCSELGDSFSPGKLGGVFLDGTTLRTKSSIFRKRWELQKYPETVLVRILHEVWPPVPISFAGFSRLVELS